MTITVEPEDYQKFLDMVGHSLAYLGHIEGLIENGDHFIENTWKDKLPGMKKYAQELLNEVGK